MPGEERAVLSPVCHPGSPTHVVYFPQSESVTIACAACGTGVIDLAVASRRSYSQRARRLELVESPKVVQRMDAGSRRNRARKADR